MVVEVRSFLTKKQFTNLLTFFTTHATPVQEDDQETFYFSGDADLRIQRNSFYSKVWLKKGKMHDAHREEIEIRFQREDFPLLEQLFLTLGFEVSIKWFRKRSTFKWKDMTVCLDFTKGYGYIIELEKMVSSDEKESTHQYLKEQLQSLEISLTPREEFEQRFQHYKDHWKTLIAAEN
ncbi:MAG: CYTH domain-containing protein [Nanoarchaeota archaeon]